MKNSLKKLSDVNKLFILHGVGVIFMILFGMWSHELAKLSPNFFSYLLFPANYSLWEQGKMLITGMSIWFIIEYIVVGRKIKGFIFIHTIIPVALPIIMLVIYMVHSAFLGPLSLEGAHIVLSVGLILTGFLGSTVMLLSGRDFSPYNPYGIVIFIVAVLLYAVFTFLPPNIGIFYDADHGVFGPYWK